MLLSSKSVDSVDLFHGLFLKYMKYNTAAINATKIIDPTVIPAIAPAPKDNAASVLIFLVGNTLGKEVGCVGIEDGCPDGCTVGNVDGCEEGCEGFVVGCLLG